MNELDTRGSHFYLALYWAEALADQNDSAALKERFRPIFNAMSAEEEKINKELLDAQGKSMDIGGYYLPDFKKASEAMRPSPTFNSILEKI